MIISTKGHYALRVMVDLAEHPGEGYIPLQEIADRQQISKEYLSSILKLLVEDGQLDSLRGKGGGYKLRHPVESYTAGQILLPVEGDLAPVTCVQDNHQCPNSIHCRSYSMWHELDTLISDYLNSVRLTDFLPNGRVHDPI